MRNFKDLAIWQRSFELVDTVYKIRAPLLTSENRPILFCA